MSIQIKNMIKETFIFNCPHCNREITFEDEDEMYGLIRSSLDNNMNYHYVCPHCGNIIVIDSYENI